MSEIRFNLRRGRFINARNEQRDVESYIEGGWPRRQALRRARTCRRLGAAY